MLFGTGFLALLELGLLVYCVFDVLTTAPAGVRTLPRPLWLVAIVLVPLVGGIGWLVAGRPRPTAPPVPLRPAHPDDDEEFLAQLRRRAEEQRRRAGETDPPA